MTGGAPRANGIYHRNIHKADRRFGELISSHRINARRRLCDLINSASKFYQTGHTARLARWALMPLPSAGLSMQKLLAD